MNLVLQDDCESYPGVPEEKFSTVTASAAIPDAHGQCTGQRDLALRIKQVARQIGFDLVGIADIRPSVYIPYIQDWFAQGRHGTMDYLARMMPAKIDIRTHLPWAASVVCVAMSYHQDPLRIQNHQRIHQERQERQAGPGLMPEPASGPGRCEPTTVCGGGENKLMVTGKIAAYAAGRDYHRIFTSLLQKLERAVRTMLPVDSMARAYVDTGPCLERDFAARAGLGWIGKNTMVIHPRHGSWFLLGELFVSRHLSADTPMPDHCGSCSRCIEACPTAALTPYQLDARQCISYLTLENRGNIPAAFHAPMRQAGYIAGCDICQTVCPFNRRPLAASHPDFQPRAFSGSVAPETILHWTEPDWDCATRGRALRRAKYAMWKRNAAILLGATDL
ncbi:MAG: tRNA epoxyqueuosine(34) reductase QueG [Phycisphaerae bacterium]